MVLILMYTRTHYCIEHLV